MFSMALVLCGGHGCVLVYKHVLLCFLGPLVSHFPSEQVKSTVAACLTGTFTLCFLPRTVLHVMLKLLTSVLSRSGVTLGLGLFNASLCSVKGAQLALSSIRLSVLFRDRCTYGAARCSIPTHPTQRQNPRPPSPGHLKIARPGSLHQSCCL